MLKFRIYHPDPRELEVQLVTSGSEITYTLWDRESAEGGEILRHIQNIEVFNGVLICGNI
jgi:hypothetical protein